MKYLPLNNKPNVSRTRLESKTPSMELDKRGNPHIVWLDQQAERNELRYSFWDGLKWSFLNNPVIAKNMQGIICSPSSLALDAFDNPYIVSAKSASVGSTLSLNSFDGSKWISSDYDISYEVDWVGIKSLYGSWDNYSSSSSSSSTSGGTSSSSSSSSHSSESVGNISSSSSSYLSSSSSSTSSESVGNNSSSSSSSSEGNSSSSSSVTSSSSSSSWGESSDSSSSSSSSHSSESVGNTSSSSTSFIGDDRFIVVVHDKTNQRFCLYYMGDVSWVYLGEMATDVTDTCSIHIGIGGPYLIVSYVKEDKIYYNFFDVLLNVWSFVSFNEVTASSGYGEIVDMDAKCTRMEDVYRASIAWISNSNSTSYVSGVFCDPVGVETNFNGATPVIYSASIDVIASDDYLVDSYRNISVCLKEPDVHCLVAGARKEHFYQLEGVWTKEVVEIQGCSGEIKTQYLEAMYDGELKMCIGDGSDIYYFVASDTQGLTESHPEFYVLSQGPLVKAVFEDGTITVDEIDDFEEGMVGIILGDAQKRVFIGESDIVVDPT